MADTAHLRKRLSALESERSTVEEAWAVIEKYVTPYRGEFNNTISSEGSVDWSKRELYDSTAVAAHQLLASSLHGAVTSPSIRWFDLRFRSEQLNKNKEAVGWLQEVASTIFFELQDSNFNLEINENYQDLSGLGTSAIVLEEGGTGSASQWGGLNFSAIPLKEVFFEEDAYGRVGRFYRKLQWTAAQILSKFGEDVPEKIKEADQAATGERFTVVYAIVPTGNKMAALGQTQTAKKRAFEACYFLFDCGTQLGESLYYYEMPAYVSRWRKSSGSQWGNSPAMTCMGDILSLNHARKLQLIASEKMIDPPIFAEERAILTDLDLSSGALSVVRDVDRIRPFGTQGNIAISDVVIQQLQESVKDVFFANQLQFPPTQGTPMSATEAQIRYEQLQKLLGPTLGRLQNDLLDPIVERAFRMLARKNQLPPVPDIVAETNPAFDVQYMGSLSRAQRVDNAASIERWVTLAANLSGVIPGILDVIDEEAVARQIGQDLNVPANVYRSAEEVAAIREQREKMQQQAQQAEVAKMQGEAAQAQNEAEM